MRSSVPVCIDVCQVTIEHMPQLPSGPAHPLHDSPMDLGEALRPAGRLARSRWAGPILLFVICCGFCWKLVLSHDYTWVDNPDIVQMDLPRLQFQRTVWQT